MNHFERDVTPSEFAGAPAAGPVAGADYEMSTIGPALDAIRRRKLALAAWVAVCIAVAGLYLKLTPSDYWSAAQVLLEPHRPLPTGTENGVSSPPAALDSAQAESQIHVVQSERVLKYVFDTLDLGNSPAYAQAGSGLRGRLVAALRSMLPHSGSTGVDNVLLPAAARARAFAAFSDLVSVRRIGQSYVLEIGFHAVRPDEAARIANAVTSAYLRDQVDTRAADVQRGVEYLQGRVALIKAERDAADAAIRNGTVPEIPFPDSDARVISAALTPIAPSSHGSLLLAFAATFGLLSGLGIVILRHSLDRTIRTREQIWAGLRTPCIGVVPRLRTGGGRGVEINMPLDIALTEPGSAFVDSLRFVRAALARTAKGEPAAIGILACDDNDGSSTIVANLAYLIAASGKPVVLVDADFRRPTLSGVLAPGASTGLGELLAANIAAPPLPLVELMPNLTMLPAAAASAEGPMHLFAGSPAMRDVVARLREHGDVLVDCPALARSSDALALSLVLDGVVVVAGAGRTTIDELAGSIRVLQSAGVSVLGVVLNKATPELSERG